MSKNKAQQMGRIFVEFLAELLAEIVVKLTPRKTKSGR